MLVTGHIAHHSFLVLLFAIVMKTKNLIKTQIVQKGDEDHEERARRARGMEFFKLIPVSTSTNFRDKKE